MADSASPCCAAGNGTWSINFWLQPSATGNPGSLFGYILSIAAGATRTNLSTTDTFAANNIDIYLPQESHPAYGMVRSGRAALLLLTSVEESTAHALARSHTRAHTHTHTHTHIYTCV